MLVCAIDVGPVWMQLVLILDERSLDFLEARRFRRNAPPGQVTRQLACWEDFHGMQLHVVGCRQDPWPRDLLQTLEDCGRPWTWVPRATVADLRGAWAYLQPDRRLLRAWMMASWKAASDACDPGSVCPAAVVECVRSVVENMLIEVSASQYVRADRSACSAHRHSRTPAADAASRPGAREAWDEVPF